MKKRKLKHVMLTNPHYLQNRMVEWPKKDKNRKKIKNINKIYDYLYIRDTFQCIHLLVGIWCLPIVLYYHHCVSIQAPFFIYLFISVLIGFIPIATTCLYFIWHENLHILFSSEINIHRVYCCCCALSIYLACSISFGWFEWLKKILCNNFYFGIHQYPNTYTCTVVIVKIQTFMDRIFSPKSNNMVLDGETINIPTVVIYLLGFFFHQNHVQTRKNNIKFIGSKQTAEECEWKTFRLKLLHIFSREKKAYLLQQK